MLSQTLLAGLLGLAGLAAAAPTRTIATRQASGAQNAVYWGATNNESNNLADYCTSTAGIDILVLSFLDIYGATGNFPSGNFGNDCFISTAGVPQSCSDLASQIKTCQSAGVKIVVSLGGAAGSYSLSSQSQAETIGQYLWDAYGNSGSTSVQRPFGDVFVNGWDFDLEVNVGSQYYQYLIATLRSNFAKDPNNKYYITGAPQCPLPEENMGVIIQNSVFDYLFIQFYNNNPTCSLGLPGDAPINFNDWTNFVSSTQSSSVKLFVGAPAGPLASNGNSGGAVYYATPSQLATVIAGVKSSPYFGGVMLWDAGYSDQNVIAGCNYAQQVKSILTTGSPCSGTPVSGGGSPPATSSTASSPPASSSSPASGSGGGSVPQWGQCGGVGYTGPTQCQSPYTCVVESQYWASCQ
ncbi:Chitinase 2 [Trichoderma asperellum]|uniref:Carbohydrate-binding module family 1 protein n=1 Tax=Trichoderma asperellum (strain ATCC 204424 / CBS 433.97 / NBRC 101777) TaxID=1042311 RepID=A0A2T3Z508_TRIA4|nr:carbohydrate-binding module family 1 protein [Trichoderma asperellum CBS 433.97]PTB39908.1 carbohydrate-binding module family 1 protein [Trichoderma asperellum CBS 433.97]UKZ90022.1 Chitinase 2 [Trichoderma asperellum]